MEGALARLADERFRIALQIVASSINLGRLDELQANLDKLPESSPKKNGIDVNRMTEQLVAVVPQIVALDLDRTTPARVLGIGRATAPVLFSAKCFGHSVSLVGRLNFVTNLLVTLYGIPSPDAKAPDELPDGQFDLMVSYGGPNLSTKQAWAAFALPLASKLTDNGRIFVALPKEPSARKNYYPDVVLGKLAQMGARVSSKNGFVLLDRAVIGRFGAAAKPQKENAPSVQPQKDADKPNDATPAPSPPPEHRNAATPVKPNWKMGAAVIGSSVALIGLLAVNWNWAGH